MSKNGKVFMKKNNYFKNKKVLVTGSSSGIGWQIAKDFLDLGCGCFNPEPDLFYQDSDGDGLVCDPDCTGGAESGCTTIPIDGGLSLLALAGGGLATAAMRRRREEEEAVQHVA